MNSDSQLLDYFDCLTSSGIVRVNNVLPSSSLERAGRIVSGILEDQICYKSFVKAGAEYREVVVSDIDPILHNYLISEFWVGTLVKSYLAKRNLKQEWRIKLIRDFSGTFDNTLWHSDTFFSTLKAFIYLNSVSKTQDVFQYMETTHIMSSEILDLHHQYASKECRQPWPSHDELSALNTTMFHDVIV